MQYEWIDDFLMAKTGVEKDIQESWNWVRYKIKDKTFVAICRDRNNMPYYINLKLDPMRGELLRSQYKDIIPGYYSNKRHWNSIIVDGKVPDDLLKDMLDESYNLILSSFSKIKQLEILRNNNDT